jgi:hypothetical protein
MARVSFACAPDQNFIVSTRTVETKEGVLDRGTQWVGWDPVTKQIRSWNFEADGGYGEGGWTKEGDEWIVKTTSVLADGSKVTATQKRRQCSYDHFYFDAYRRDLRCRPGYPHGGG